MIGIRVEKEKNEEKNEENYEDKHATEERKKALDEKPVVQLKIPTYFPSSPSLATSSTTTTTTSASTYSSTPSSTPSVTSSSTPSTPTKEYTSNNNNFFSTPTTTSPRTPKATLDPLIKEKLDTAIKFEQFLTITYNGDKGVQVFTLKPVGWKKEPSSILACYPKSNKEFCFSTFKMTNVTVYTPSATPTQQDVQAKPSKKEEGQ